MLRPRRLHVEGGYYHVTPRRNHREAIFLTPADREPLAEARQRLSSAAE